MSFLPAADGVETAVFINCPYDAAFGPLFDAIFFTCVCCGCLPRSAIDSGSSGTARIERIMATLRACRYSIHDLSRFQGEGEGNLARFNMPLELGMAMMLAELAPGAHEWMPLAPTVSAFDQYISDLRGFDIERYDGTVSTLVPKVAAWLLTRPAALGTVLTPQEMVEALPAFAAARRLLLRDWIGSAPPWSALVRIARETID